MPTALTVLIVEEHSDEAELLAEQLTLAGFHLQWQRVASEAEYQMHLTPPPDLIVCGWTLPHFNCQRALHLLREQGLDIPFIIVAGSIGEEAAVDALHTGAYDYVLKDHLSRLGLAAQRSLQDKQARVARQEAEAKLYASEERFRLALKNSPIVVFTQDRDLRYTWVYNPHPGFDPQVVIGKTDADLLPSADSDGLITIKRRVLQTGVTAREEVRTTINGQPFFYDLTVEPLHNTTGAVIGITCISVDITERKRLDAKARETEAQLQQQERLATVGQLAAGIAHDFNNILTVILTYSQMLMQTPTLSERNQQRLQVIHEQATRATDLTRQVLDFSRQAVLERRLLDLQPLLQEQIKLLERTLPESIVLRLAYGQGACVVHADPTSIQQVVMNLAINARDAMPTGGNLTIGIERVTVTPDNVPLPKMPAGDWVQLTIQDSGAGIPPTVLPHIFDPFFTTKAPGKGTGLGLAQVYGIVSQHEGYINVKTAVGTGTTFTIYLPALDTQSPALPQATATALRQGQGQLLLVVEDNPALRMALVDMLTLLNYRVMEAGNGHEALSVLATDGEEVALVLSDVVMPAMDGVTLLHALREQGWTKPVILLTGHPLDQAMETLWSSQIHRLLRKPPNLAELDQAITSALAITAVQSSFA